MGNIEGQEHVADCVRRTVEARGMLPGSASPVVLMVSGGSDSVALARLLPRLYPGHAYTVLHVNHRLRGEDADEDERFVVALARELGLPCEVRRIDVAALAAAQTNGNVEEVGRTARYRAADELLDGLCRRGGYALEQGRIITAHTRDDRVETLFMRLIVGGGASGLSSIPFVNGRTVRPLLDCTRVELRDWLRTEAAVSADASDCARARHSVLDTESNGNLMHDDGCSTQTTRTQEPHQGFSHRPTALWREDGTNRDTRRLRAFVRHEVIPLLESRNPRLLATVARSLDVLADEDASIRRQADELFGEVASPLLEDAAASVPGTAPAASPDSAPDTAPGTAPDGLKLSAALFDAEPPIARRVVRTACRCVMPPTARLTSEHIENIVARGRHIGFATDIPGDVTVRNVYGTLIVRRKTAAEKPKHDPRRLP